MNTPPHKPVNTSPLGRLSIVSVVVLLLAYWTIVTLLAPLGAAMALLSDDAFYYFKIARNILAGAGCTFDGIAPTNGFHPLWMVFVMLIHKLFPGPDAAVVATMVFGGALCAAALILLSRLVDRFIAPGFGIVAVAAALLPNLLNAMLNGMETALQLFVLILILWECHRRGLLDPSGDRGTALWLGVLLGVATLARLDSVFLFVAAMLMTASSIVAGAAARRAAWRRGLLIASGFSAVFLPYLLWNVASFGHLTPISGAAKSAFPSLVQPLRLGGDKAIGALMIATMLVLNAPVLRGLGSGRTGLAKASRSPIFMLVLASLLHFAHVFLFLDWGVYWWHFTMYGLAIVIGLAQAAAWATRSRPRARTGLAIALAVMLTGLAGAMKVREVAIRKPMHEGWLAAARWARDNLEPDAVLALADAGLFGYYSERQVINLDGKANGYDYQRAVYADDVDGYLRRAGTNYIAHIRIRYSEDGTYRIPIARVNQRSAKLTVYQSREVYRGPEIPSDAPRFGPPVTSHFVIWRYGQPD